MGIDHAERGVLLAQMRDDAREQRVLDDIGKVAGMEGVSVIHRARQGDGPEAFVKSRQLSAAGSAVAAPQDPDQRSASAAADRRHHHLVAAAGAAVDLRAVAELQILRHADPHLAQPPTVAGHGDALPARGPGLASIKAFSTSPGVTARYFVTSLNCAGICTVSRALRTVSKYCCPFMPAACAVPVPLVKHQPRRRHDVEHGVDDVARQPRRRHLTVARKAALILRPETVHHERIGPLAGALLQVGAAAIAFARGFAERRRPRQGEHIEIELARLVARIAPVVWIVD